MSYVTAAQWAAGPDRIYRALAVAAVDLLPDLRGALVLDAGTGTGAAADALRMRGARVLPVDRSPDMLAFGDPALPVVGDVTALPLRAGCVDGAVAAFVLNHLSEPLAGLAELRRVTRAGGPVLATTFPTTPHPVKTAVDEVLAARGLRAPRWYVELRAGVGRTGSAERLRALASAAGLSGVDVRLLRLDLAGRDPAVLVAWRLGMAQTAPWLATLDPAARDRVRDDAVAAVAALGPPPPLEMLALRATPRRSWTYVREMPGLPGNTSKIGG